MEVTGKVKKVNDEQQVSATFKKRELVIVTDAQYPETILIEFVQDKCDLLNDLQVGQNITVGINLAGREWINPQGETKYFNSIKGWRIDKSGTNANVSEYKIDNPTYDKATTFTPTTDINGQEYDDLPF